MQYDFCYPAKNILMFPVLVPLKILAFYTPTTPWEGLTMMLCSKGNKCNNNCKGGKLIKKLIGAEIFLLKTKLKTNFIKKVDLLTYNFITYQVK